MIRALRERHYQIMTVLTLVLPIAFLGVVLGRQPRAPHPPPLMADRGGRHPIGPAFALLDTPRIKAQLLADSGTVIPDALEVTPTLDPGIPDLLAYWAATPPDGHALPPDAFLIGALRGSRQQVLPLPEPGRMRGGFLILYSAVRREAIATTSLPATP
jgi:hypothetical protein